MNLPKLISSQVSKNGGQFILCDRCLNHCYTPENTKKHQSACSIQNSGQIVMPNDDKKILKFEHFKNKLEVPYIIYADIETLLQ